MKLLMLENDDENYQQPAHVMEAFNLIAQEHGYDVTEVLYRLPYITIEEMSKALDDCDAVYVNSNVVNLGQYRGMLDAITRHPNIKEIFFADWQYEGGEFDFNHNTYKVLKDPKCRRILHYLKFEKNVSIHIVFDADFHTRELVRFVLDDQTNEHIIEVL